MTTIPKNCPAYAGGLDTAVNLRWLIETYPCPVVAFVANVEQGEDLEGFIRLNALRLKARALRDVPHTA